MHFVDAYDFGRRKQFCKDRLMPGSVRTHGLTLSDMVRFSIGRMLVVTGVIAICMFLLVSTYPSGSVGIPPCKEREPCPNVGPGPSIGGCKTPYKCP
jgi:hypothetical protein